MSFFFRGPRRLLAFASLLNLLYQSVLGFDASHVFQASGEGLDSVQSVFYGCHAVFEDLNLLAKPPVFNFEVLVFADSTRNVPLVDDHDGGEDRNEEQAH